MRHWWLGQARVIRPVLANFRFVLGSSFCPFWGAYFCIFWPWGGPKSSNFDEKIQNAINVQKGEKATKNIYVLFCFGLHFGNQKSVFFVILAPGRISGLPLKSAPRPLLLESAPERSWGIPASILVDFGS